MAHIAQDWDTVVLTKGKQKSTQGNKNAELNKAFREGAQVETEKKFGGGGNSNHGTAVYARKLDDETEDFHHASLGHDFKMALQKARLDKKMGQAALAKAINEKASVVNDYESGKVVPNMQVISKMERALGCKLPRPQKPKKVKNAD